MIKNFISNAEIEELGEGLIREYAQQTKTVFKCVDIEGFITDFLRCPIEYIHLAEKDKDKIGYLSNGIYPLRVCSSAGVSEVVFPKNTIVLDRLLLRACESGRRRFTLAHEAAHIIVDRINPTEALCFHRVFDNEQTYDAQALAERFSLNEYQASAMAAVLLMPRYLMKEALDNFNGGRRLPIYGTCVFHPREKVIIQKMADSMGVSFTAMFIRLRGFGMLNYHPLSEYIEKVKKGGDDRAGGPFAL